MYDKYSKNIVSNFEKNMLEFLFGNFEKNMIDFFLKPGQKVENYQTMFEETDDHIIKYMRDTLIKMSKKDLLKIYKNIFDVIFNPNRDSDMKNSSENQKKILVTEIIEYIQCLSESLLIL